MTNGDGWRAAMALLRATLDDDQEAVTVLIEHTDPGELIRGLVQLSTTMLKVMAEADGQPLTAGTDLLARTLRKIA